ncbi:MAG TPA: hypothetical protein VEG84_02580 [Thermoanaerobaculia bacterium]|nr:hypothetical protein [Thermoanaerobaculia bacterium]
MLKRWKAPVLVVLTCGLLVACGQEKKMAEAAMKTAEDAVNAAGPDVAKFAADQWKGVTDALAAAKDSLAKGDYKTALASANDVAQKVKDAAAAASAKKDELTKTWNDAYAALPQAIESVKSKIGELSSMKKLPAGMDKAKLEDAKTGLTAANQSWSDAVDAFKAGNLTDAVAKAGAAKDKATALLQALGLSAPAGGAAPATK